MIMKITKPQIEGFLDSKGLSRWYAEFLSSLLLAPIRKDDVYKKPHNMGGGDIVKLQGTKKIINICNGVYSIPESVKEEMFKFCPVCGHNNTEPVKTSDMITWRICTGCRVPRNFFGE